MPLFKKFILKLPIFLLILAVLHLNACFNDSGSSTTQPLAPHELTPDTTPPGKRIVAYLPYYSWDYALNNTLQLDKVTHICLAFANPDANGNFSIPVADSKIHALVDKVHDLDKKILISIGGGGSDKATVIYDTLISTSNVQNTIDKLLNFVKAYRLDGIDVDLEGNRITNDYNRYNNFIIKLSNSLPDNNMILTAALAKWSADQISDTALSKFDFINVMAYDATGSWAPLNKGPHSSYQFAVDNIDYWAITRSLPVTKICLGVPFYGYDFSQVPDNMGIAYRDILLKHPESWNVDKIGDIYYNGAQTIKDKTILSKQYGGIMIWEISQDVVGTRSLLDVIYTNMQ